MTATLTDSALAILRRSAIATSMVTASTGMESTPEGAWHAEEQRRRDTLERSMHTAMWEMRQEYQRQFDWQIIFGDKPMPPRIEPMSNAMTPEQCYHHNYE